MRNDFISIADLYIDKLIYLNYRHIIRVISMKTDQCIKEWNATIEALGNGLQTVMIRVYPTNKEGFLLYPTWTYTLKDNYLEGFKKEYQKFVVDNSKDSDNKIRTIKYYASCEEIIELPLNKIANLDKSFIWTKDHVKSYINQRKAFIWILRVYKLDKTTNVSLASGQIYGKINTKIDISNLTPVLADKEFNELKKAIKDKL